MSTDLLGYALDYRQAGRDVIPDHPTKKYPAGITGWQKKHFTDDELRHYICKLGWGIGIRNQEGLDFDNKGPLAIDLFKIWRENVDQLAPGLVNRLLIERTQNDGYHVAWNCEVIEGNQELAQRLPTPEEKKADPKLNAVTLIETRGKGGQFMVAPSPGYELLQGDWLHLPIITPAERKILIDCARALNRLPKREHRLNDNGIGDRPGDLFNQNGQTEALGLLEKAGWTKVRESRDGRVKFLRRPGKNDGISATYGYVAEGVFYCFTSNGSPFELNSAYDPFAIYTLLEHAGDYKQSAKRLAERFSVNGHNQDDIPPESGDDPEPDPAEELDGDYKPTGSSWAELQDIIGPIEWDWPGWLPRGFQVLLVAKPGEGKSNLILHIARCFLTGSPWPDGSPFTGETGEVLWCETESAQALNLERARVWGLPVDKIKSPLNNPLDDVSLDNPEHQGAIYSAARRDEVRLIIVDSLSGGTTKDAGKSNKMLEVGLFLAGLARDTGKPVLTTHHLRKKGLLDGDRVTLDQVRDSSAITQTSRVIWAIDTPDIESEHLKRLYAIKSNFAKMPGEIGFEVKDDGLTFGDAPQPPREESQIDKAIDLLRAVLDKEPLTVNDLEQHARGAAISWPTMKRAKKKLNVVSRYDGESKVWYWGLPAKEYSNTSMGMF